MSTHQNTPSPHGCRLTPGSGVKHSARAGEVKGGKWQRCVGEHPLASSEMLIGARGRCAHGCRDAQCVAGSCCPLHRQAQPFSQNPLCSPLELIQPYAASFGFPWQYHPHHLWDFLLLSTLGHRRDVTSKRRSLPQGVYHLTKEEGIDEKEAEKFHLFTPCSCSHERTKGLEAKGYPEKGRGV